jgi:cystathionine beta-lyase
MPKLRQLGWPHQGGLVRFCMGLEAAADLKADIVQALPALAGSR